MRWASKSEKVVRQKNVPTEVELAPTYLETDGDILLITQWPELTQRAYTVKCLLWRQRSEMTLQEHVPTVDT